MRISTLALAAAVSGTAVSARDVHSNSKRAGVTSIAAAGQLTGNVALGSCPHIAIGFGQGIDNRKETAFVNADLTQFAQGSADNPNIITNFSCDNLINKCGLNQQSPGHATCLKAKAAVLAAGKKDGSAADLWNSFFGITTDFASLAVVDDTGKTIAAGAGSGAATAAATTSSVSSGNNLAAAANGKGGNGGGNNKGQRTAASSAASGAAATGAAAASGQNQGNKGGNKGGNNGGNNNGGNGGGNLQTSLTLDPSQVQSNLANNGQNPPVAGQSASQTSTNNFINFCATQGNLPLTNGQQVKTGSCNPTPMGVIVAQSVMPSCKFQFPANLDTIQANQNFTVKLAINNFQAGVFTNAQQNYFAAPATVNGQGQIIGHSHVVIEAIDSITSRTVSNPTNFAFFKGIDTAAVNGVLSADVTGGLPAGTYKISTINSAANHQPVLVAVAQHGSLDDVVYFTVSNNAGAAASGGNAGENGGGNAAASASATANAGGNAANKGQGQRQGQNKGQGQGQNKGQGQKKGGKKDRRSAHGSLRQRHI